MIRTKTGLLFFGVAGSIALAACGGAGEAKAPARAAEPAPREPTSIAEAQEQIDRARAELSLDAEAAKKAEGDKLDKDYAPPPSPAGESTGGSVAKPTSPQEERASSGDSCSSSCRALSSMRRAVSALCRMTGDEDARCSDARRTLEQSESRVARCHCGT